MLPEPIPVRPRVAVSRCLRGDAVRYDGASRISEEVVHVIAPQVTLVALCPELEAGMGVPRPPIQLHKSGAKLQLIRIHDRTDMTAAMQATAARLQSVLASVHGLVLKSRSPSCGLRDTPWFRDDGECGGTGPGWLLRQLSLPPGLPVVDEQELSQPGAAEDFLRRVHRQMHSQAGAG